MQKVQHSERHLPTSFDVFVSVSANLFCLAGALRAARKADPSHLFKAGLLKYREKVEPMLDQSKGEGKYARTHLWWSQIKCCRKSTFLLSNIRTSIMDFVKHSSHTERCQSCESVCIYHGLWIVLVGGVQEERHTRLPSHEEILEVAYNARNCGSLLACVTAVCRIGYCLV